MPGQYTGIQIKSYGSQTDHWEPYTDNSDPYDTISSLLYFDGVTASPVTFRFTSSDTSFGQGNVGTNSANDDFEASVRRSAFYITSSGTDMNFAFGGLDNAKTYKIKAIASRASGGTNRKGLMTINSDAQVLDAGDGGDAAELGEWTVVSPSGGEIAGTYVINTGSAYCYLNGLLIQEEDAGGGPTPKFLILLGAGA